MAPKGSKKVRPAAALDQAASTDEWQDRDDLADDAGDVMADRLEQVVGDEPAEVPARRLITPPKPSDITE